MAGYNDGNRIAATGVTNRPGTGVQLPGNSTVAKHLARRYLNEGAPYPPLEFSASHLHGQPERTLGVAKIGHQLAQHLQGHRIFRRGLRRHDCG